MTQEIITLPNEDINVVQAALFHATQDSLGATSVVLVHPNGSTQIFQHGRAVHNIGTLSQALEFLERSLDTCPTSDTAKKIPLTK